MQFEVRVQCEQENEALAHRACCAQYTYNCVRLVATFHSSQVYAPHFFLGNCLLGEVKCSASMVVVTGLSIRMEGGTFVFMTQSGAENATPIAEVRTSQHEEHTIEVREFLALER